MECLDANAVQDLMAGALDDSARAQVMGHLDGCTDCRSLVGALARDAVPSAARDAARAARTAPARTAHAVDAALAETYASGTADPLAATSASFPGGHLDETADVSAADPLAATTRSGSHGSGGKLGRYTALERLGAGAMGVVYRAEDSELGRRVALKLIKRPDPELTERLVREARAMAQVTHPNVVAVYEVGQADGSTYIAMELVEGESLRAWQTGNRTVAEILAAYAAAGRGLAAAHAAGIIHRDFKPDNVLVGNDGRMRVTDFGLAASRPAAGGAPVTGRASSSPSLVDVNLTTAGSVLGTPAYMAPEQFTGGNVDPRTDQFNFCVALYEALYGVRPFAGKSFPELGDNVCDGRMTPAPARSRVSSEVRAIVLRGLSVKPGDRFPTMDHLVAELGRDRARPWRRAAIAATLVGAALALWLVADVALRDRAAVEIGAAFRMTGVQIERALAVRQLAFTEHADNLNSQSAIHQLAAHHDLADFGLGGAQADSDDLSDIHSQIESSSWAQARGMPRIGADGKPDVDADTLAVIDAKGRLIYSTASAVWGTNVDTLPQVKHALDTGGGAAVAVLAYDDPALAATHLFAKPRTGLAVIYDRALSFGDDDTTNAKETRAVFVEVVDGAQLLADIRLDDKTRLALVAPDGRAIGDLVDANDPSYVVQSLPIPGAEDQGKPARIVMANPVGGLTLFPHARLVFALGLLAALGVAGATGLHARRTARA
jgi:serine/threonine protein kinase